MPFLSGFCPACRALARLVELGIWTLGHIIISSILFIDTYIEST